MGLLENCSGGRLFSDKNALYIIPENLRDGFVWKGMNRVVRAGAGVRTVALSQTKASYL
jgi:hypothetical protein